MARLRDQCYFPGDVMQTLAGELSKSDQLRVEHREQMFAQAEEEVQKRCESTARRAIWNNVS